MNAEQRVQTGFRRLAITVLALAGLASIVACSLAAFQWFAADYDPPRWSMAPALSTKVDPRARYQVPKPPDGFELIQPPESEAITEVERKRAINEYIQQMRWSSTKEPLIMAPLFLAVGLVVSGLIVVVGWILSGFFV